MVNISYLLTLILMVWLVCGTTSASGDNSTRAELEAAVELSCNKLIMTLVINETVFPRNSSTITLNNCGDQTVGNQLIANFSNCESSIIQYADTIIMKTVAEVTSMHMDPLKIITRTIVHKYDLQCSFDRRLNVSSTEVNVHDDPAAAGGCPAGFYRNSSGVCEETGPIFKTEVQLNLNFTDDLTNPTSALFQYLARIVENGILAILQHHIPGVAAVNVISFRPGSVFAEFDIVMSLLAPSTNISQLEAALHAGIITGNFSDLPVNRTYLPPIHNAIDLTCGRTNFTAVVDDHALPGNISDIELTYCNESDYQVIGNKVSANLSSCAILVSQDNDTITMGTIARVSVLYVDSTGTIQRVFMYSYKLHCTFDRLSNESVPHVVEVIEFQVTAQTHFRASMDIYQSNSFSQIAASPVEVTAYEPIFIQVKSVHDTQSLKFITEECYATPTASPNSLTKYLFFDDKCSVDFSFKEYQKNTHNKFSFSIDAFRFLRVKNEVYFHCQLLVCLRSSSTEECTQECTKLNNRRRRRAISGAVERLVVNSVVVRLKELKTCANTLCPSNSYCIDIIPVQCRCNDGYVFDSTTKQCTNNNIIIIRGVSLNMEFKTSYYDTSSTEFLTMATTTEKALITVMDGKVITGVKVFKASPGSVIVDVQVCYPDHVSPQHAFNSFVSSILGTTSIGSALNINKDVIPYMDEIKDIKRMDQNTKTTIIIAVVITALVMLIPSIIAIVFLDRRRRSSQQKVTITTTGENNEALETSG